MDKLDLSQATATKGQPLLNNSLDWIQGALRSMIGNIARTIVGKDNFDTNKFVVLYGMEMTGTVIGAGAVYNTANNEIFIVQSVDTAGYSNIPVLKTDFRNDGSLDPITFSDGTTGNVHKIRLYEIVDDVTGSGVVDYADLVFLNNVKLSNKIIPIGDWNMDSTSSVLITHGLDYTKIKSINVIIRNDSDTERLPLLPIVGSNLFAGGTFEFDSTSIFLRCFANAEATSFFNGATTSAFDNTNHDSTSYNRGWVNIEFVD